MSSCAWEFRLLGLIDLFNRKQPLAAGRIRIFLPTQDTVPHILGCEIQVSPPGPLPPCPCHSGRTWGDNHLPGCFRWATLTIHECAVFMRVPSLDESSLMGG